MPLPTNIYFNLASDLRSGYLTLINRVPCARVVSCVARLEGKDSFTIDPFFPVKEQKSFTGFKYVNTAPYENLLQNLPPD